MQYITNFKKSRSAKIGASEIASCIPHPERSGSVAGYDQTALTVFQEKTGVKERDPAGFQAEMGKELEPAILRKWLRENYDDLHDPGRKSDMKYSDILYRGHILCEFDKTKDGYPNAESYQIEPFLHHTKAECDFAIAHTDMIDPTQKAGVIVEAKSTSYWASRRKDDPYTGYDLNLKGNQGIPLRNYFQVQFQAAIYNLVYGIEFEKLHLALLFDTNNYHSWEIKPHKKTQERLLEIASRMKKCIDTNTPPKEYAMNQSDIKLMYPKIEEDYKVISGEELEAALELAKNGRSAAKQESLWKVKKTDANDALSIILKDTGLIKGIIDGELTDIVRWEERKGGEKLTALSKIEKDGKEYKYLKRNGLIEVTAGSRNVKIKFKGE